jgi:ribosomal-protein-alanine N-acetyltransferase
MMRLGPRVRIATDRLVLRPPQHTDFRAWAALRRESCAFLTPWEPTWASDHLTRRSFTNRVYWAGRSIAGGTGLPLFMLRAADDVLLGAVTLDNIRRGPAQAATLGYWIGAQYARRGYMTEAVRAVVAHAFEDLGLSRIESACLPENDASRGVLERCGFEYEGKARNYLQIAGRWRTHVLFANLRADRRSSAPGG